jgi:hypothetical protein
MCNGLTCLDGEGHLQRLLEREFHCRQLNKSFLPMYKTVCAHEVMFSNLPFPVVIDGDPGDPGLSHHP